MILHNFELIELGENVKVPRKKRGDLFNPTLASVVRRQKSLWISFRLFLEPFLYLTLKAKVQRKLYVIYFLLPFLCLLPFSSFVYFIFPFSWGKKSFGTKLKQHLKCSFSLPQSRNSKREIRLNKVAASSGEKFYPKKVKEKKRKERKKDWDLQH